MRFWCVFSAVALCSGPAFAQIDLRTAEQKAAPNTWNVTLGARVGAASAFPGSKDTGFTASPVFSLGRGIGSRWLAVADDNIGIGLVEGDYWRAGVAGKVLWGRNESSHAALRGLGDTRFGGEIGGFAEVYPLSWLRARAELRHGVFAHDALTGDLKLDAFTKVGDSWTLSVGPRLSFAGRDYTQTYFGVDAGQSVRSGLPVHKAADGLVSFGATAQVAYQWNARLRSTAYAQAIRLANDAARSPLVIQRGSRDQFGVGVSTSYAFDTGW